MKLRYCAITFLLLLTAHAQKVASTNQQGPNGSMIGRNYPVNWLYIPTDANGYLMVDGLGGGGGGGSTTLQTNSAANTSQTLLNFSNSATVHWANPSGGVETASVVTATPSVLGASSPDNVSIGAASGVYSVVSPGANTLIGFNASNIYTGFLLGTGLSVSGGNTINVTTTGGPAVQSNGTNNSSQTLLNFLNTSNTTWTNPSGGVEQLAIATSTPTLMGLSSPDNTTISAASGVYSIKSLGDNLLGGFNASGVWTGFGLGTGLAFSGGNLTLSGGGITGTLVTNCIPVATGTGTVGCSSATDNGTTFTISDSGGLQLNAGTPSKISLPAGTGSIPALPANSAGFAAPTGTFTSYLIGLAPGITASGYPILSAPTTVAGVNQVLMSVGNIEFTIGSSGQYGFLTAPVVVAQAKALNSGHFVSLTVTNTDGGSCPTAPTFNIFDMTTSGTTVTGSTTEQAAGTASVASQTQSITAGDYYGVKMTGAGSGCTAPNFSVYATVEEP